MTTNKADIQLQHYIRLADITREIASTLNLDELLKRIVSEAADLCQAEAASILLYADPENLLFFETSTNLDANMMQGLKVPVDRSIAGWIVKEKKPIIVHDVTKDERYFTLIAQDTHYVTKSLLGVPMYTKDQVIGVIQVINKKNGIFTDQDQEIMMAMAAQAAVAIQNARLFQQSDLIADLVHEIRTPLTSLKSAVHLLRRTDILSEQRQGLIKVIDSEVNRLSEMTTSFLEIARLESRRIQYSRESVDPKILIQDCVLGVKSHIIDKGLALHLQIDPGLPRIHVARDRIKQVLLNLLSNAIKYNNPNGSITISAWLEGDTISISVADKGPGIAPPDMVRLFEKFYRVPGTGNDTEGSGLGLSICKRIVEIHGGNIKVNSELGVGTTFTVELPIKS